MKIVVYTTRTCAYCKQVMKWLEHKGKQYTTYDVTDDVEMRKALYEKTSYTTVPIIQIGEKYIVGPQFGKIAEALV